MPNLRLIAINERGKPAEPISDLPDIASEIGAAQVNLYASEGYQPPWTGYFAVSDGRCVGCCSYKSPPRQGRVEIAYFTFPPFEGQRIATTMAEQLVKMAADEDPTLLVTAQTLPEENPSTAILTRLGFELIGPVEHPEDGTVWQWELAPRTPADRERETS